MADGGGFDLVVIGSSAGGIESLSRLLGALTSKFPLPIIVAQHLDPTHPSRLAEVLARHSALPVRLLVTHDPLERGVVHVVPAGNDADLTGAGVTLTPHERPGPTPSIDRLLRSAAGARGEGVIAVILTGAGSDGSAGAAAVKESGGTVLIEDPQTASHASMPGSVAPGLVDAAATPARLGQLLERMVVEQADSDGDARAVTAILDRIRERSGIDFSTYKPATIHRRLRQRVAATDAQGIEAYARYLDEHPEEHTRLVHSLLIKVTEFMRDPELFAALGESVLPDLIERARRRGDEVRVWSAGCATGEEAYSIAILLCEQLGEVAEVGRVRVFATDVDPAAINHARHGVYPAGALAALAPERVARYFTPLPGERYQVKKRLRSMVVFGEHDLAQRAPFPRIDLVVCRNVLIYFNAELQRRVLSLFAYALREDGYLVLGRAETATPLGEFFVPHPSTPRVFLRRGGRAPIPSVRLPLGQPLPAPVRGKRTAASAAAPPSTALPTRAPFETLVQNFPLGVVIVDRGYDILEINLAARRLLGIHAPALGEDFVHLAHVVPHRALLDLIEAAFKGASPAPLHVPAVPREGLEAGDLEIACYPQRFEAGAAVTECVLVLVADVTDTCARIGDLERKAATESAAGATAARRADEMKAALATVTEDNRGLRVEVEALRAAQLRSEAGRVEAAANLERLTETNRRLASANDELAGAIERLRGVNEELVVRTEEAQAAHEEVETLNEEFQASNEELEALNEELQATVEELSTTNNELEARNVEIADLARATQAEREKLAATLLGIGDALLAVDPEGRPLFQNPAYAETFGEGVTLCDPDGRPLPPASAPAARAARGDVFREDLTIAEPSGVVRYFEACGHPIQGPTGHAGGVVVIRDITDRSVRRLQDQFLAIASHELRTPLVPLTGYLDMLIQELEGGDPRVRRYAVQAHHELERLAGLVNDLVDVVRLRTGKLALHRAPVDLRGLLESAVAVTRGGAKVPPIEVGASGPGEPILVSADAARLEQVVINLLVNAAKHATGTPRIEVRLRRVGVAGEQAEIVVEDFGRGIAAADLPHIFQSFYQGERRDRPSRGGMGLGLFIVREIVEAHGGTVAVDSELGRGTRMTVRLPLAEAARAAPAGETKESA